MKTYRCKHAVEAAQWIDTDANRKAFSDWFAEHDVEFETRGSVVIVDGLEIDEGEWILIDRDGDFIVLDDQEFRRDYEESER